MDQTIIIPKNPLGVKGTMMRMGRNHGEQMVMSYKSRQWASGKTNDKTATWRRNRGLGHGHINAKMLKGKTAK